MGLRLTDCGILLPMLRIARAVVFTLLALALPACPRKVPPPPPAGLVVRDGIHVPMTLADLPIAVTKLDVRRLRENGRLEVEEIKVTTHSRELGTSSTHLRTVKVRGPDGLSAEISFSDGVERMTSAWVRTPSERRELLLYSVPGVGEVLFERYRIPIDTDGKEGTPRFVDVREHWDPFPAMKDRLDRSTTKETSQTVASVAGYTSRFGPVDMRLLDAALAKYAGDVDARNMLWLHSCDVDIDVVADRVRPATPETTRMLQEAIAPRIAREKDGWLVSHAVEHCFLFSVRHHALDLARPEILRLAAMACAAKTDVEFNRASVGVVGAVKTGGLRYQPSDVEAAAARKAVLDGLAACPDGPYKTKLAERIAP